MRVVAALLLVVAALPLAAQQVLYKWTDEQGRVQYSDRPPKNFKGPVTRIEMDPAPPPVAPSSPVPPAPADGPPAVDGRRPSSSRPAPPEGPQDLAGKRRTLREQLRARIDAAQAKLDAAKEALASAQPGDEERQVIQQVPKSMPGQLSADKRANCRAVKGADGKDIVQCAALVPSGGYYERVQALEQKVKDAERELDEAETAYRKGVD